MMGSALQQTLPCLLAIPRSPLPDPLLLERSSHVWHPYPNAGFATWFEIAIDETPSNDCCCDDRPHPSSPNHEMRPSAAAAAPPSRLGEEEEVPPVTGAERTPHLAVIVDDPVIPMKKAVDCVIEEEMMTERVGGTIRLVRRPFFVVAHCYHCYCDCCYHREGCCCFGEHTLTLCWALCVAGTGTTVAPVGWLSTPLEQRTSHCLLLHLLLLLDKTSHFPHHFSAAMMCGLCDPMPA